MSWKLHTKDRSKIYNKCWWTSKDKEAQQEKTLLGEIKCWTYKSNLNKQDRRLTLLSQKNLIFNSNSIELTVKNGFINLKMPIKNFKTLFLTHRLNSSSLSQITRTFRTCIPMLKTNSARHLRFLLSWNRSTASCKANTRLYVMTLQDVRQNSKLSVTKITILTKNVESLHKKTRNFKVKFKILKKFHMITVFKYKKNGNLQWKILRVLCNRPKAN